MFFYFFECFLKKNKKILKKYNFSSQNHIIVKKSVRSTVSGLLPGGPAPALFCQGPSSGKNEQFCAGRSAKTYFLATPNWLEVSVFDGKSSFLNFFGAKKWSKSSLTGVHRSSPEFTGIHRNAIVEKCTGKGGKPGKLENSIFGSKNIQNIQKIAKKHKNH